MNGILKKIATVACAFAIMTTPIACKRPNPNPQPDLDPQNPPINQPVETEQTKAEKLYFKLVNSMKGGKFTLSNGSKTYKFSGGRAEIDGGVYFMEDGRNVCIVDGVKNFTDTSAVASRNIITAQFDGAVFDEYSNGVLSGTLSNGDEISVRVSSDKIEMTVNGETWTVSDIGNTVVNTQDYTQDKTTGQQTGKTLQEAAAEVNKFLDEVQAQQKFTFTETKNSTTEKYSLLNGLLKAEKGGVETIYEEDGGQTYAYTQQNGAWTKEVSNQSFSNILSTFDNFVTSVKNANWSDFNSNQLSGSYQGKTVQATLPNNGSISFQVGDSNVTISKNVEAFAKPGQVTDVTDESEKLWENVAGQRVYNYKLLAQTLEDWIKENDYLKSIYFNLDYKLNNILYLNNKSTELEIVALITNSNKEKLIQNYTLNTTNLNEEKNSIEKLKNYLTSTNKPIKTTTSSPIEIEYSSLDATPEQKTEMEGLTQSVFNEIAENGWRLNQSSQPTKLEYFKNLKVLFSARTALSGSSAGGGIGESQGWYQYYLVDKNGELQWIYMNVRSSIGGMSPIERVIEDHDELWFCGEPQIKDVDKGNSQLYDNVLKTSAKSLNL